MTAARLASAIARAVLDARKRRELGRRLLEYEEYDRFLRAIAAPRTTRAGHASDFVQFPLLVTTNRGLYLLDNGSWHCLLPIVCFGVARHGETLFLGASAGIHSFVLSAKLVSGTSPCQLRNVQILAGYETRYHNERIHQIAYDPQTNVLHCANCRRNSLLTVDPDGRGVLDEKFLFVDGTGFPVYTDQNHVNSVTMHGDAVLFAAHSAGRDGAALGFISDDHVRAYYYAARGVHDIVIHDNGIMFTDSFRDGSAAQNPNASGAIRFRGEEFLSDAIDAISRKLVLRGLAMRGTELAVGYSAYAQRHERFAESGGGVLIIRDGVLLGLAEGPFAQVYDILPIDGVRTAAAGPPRSVAELDQLFRRDVGPLLYEGPLPRAPRLSVLR